MCTWLSACAAHSVALARRRAEAPDGIGKCWGRSSSPGSEETLIPPQQETVLRVVRRTDAEPLTFAIESIQANAGESNRFTINSDETRTIRLGEEEVKLRFLPLYSRQVEITSLPGGWLLWPALVLCVIGLWGLRRKPAFALVQIAPWHSDRSVMIVQGSDEFASLTTYSRQPVLAWVPL